MKLFSPVNLLGKAIFRGMSPKQARMLQIPLDFSDPTAGGAIKVQLNIDERVNNNYGISGIQSVYLDNSANASTLIITFDNGYELSIPSFASGIFPVLFSGTALNFTAVSAGNVAVSATFLNTREQAQAWSTRVPLTGIVDVSGSTVFVEPINVNATDRSATLAAAGVSQTLMAANPNRRRMVIQNRSTAAGQGGIAGAEYAFFNLGAAAIVNGAGSFELYPGASYDTAGGPCPTDAITWTAPTAGHYIVAKEY